jgi:predicted GNAT family N-acyltransferase
MALPSLQSAGAPIGIAVTVEIFDPSDGDRMREALAVRFAVFVREQQVPPEIEIDEFDRPGAAAVHALVRDGDGQTIGTGRFYARDAQTVQLGRMAVVASARGRGAGRAVLDALINEGRRRGYALASLHAQTHAIAFYEAAGFIARGEIFLDANIPHVEMARDL